ncbi:hypothetical protein KUCAC02_017572 [Chaenocephalus aceratus]|uniref:Uncharacterized protein n=1 Tax=Chaenocephalus aceratus TaxID=36190 RepID=A0ACB9W314_CHAAC|nr:hypothetical protein KUCAC02_017572 [Chaenocephalus aceratus]
MYTLQGAPSFIPASGFCHTPAGKETEVRRFTIAKLISEQTSVPLMSAGSSSQKAWILLPLNFLDGSISMAH